MELLTLIPSMLQIAGGSLIIGLAISYAYWCRVRVTFLREDLFIIRDSLWESARELDRFDDPAYQKTREMFNTCIRAASFMSLPQVIGSLVMARADESVNEDELKSDCKEMQAAIDEAGQKLVKRVSTYLLRDRFVSGSLLVIVAIVTLGSTVKLLRFASMIVDSWRKSQGPSILSSGSSASH
jgi:hypothetical protein